MSEELKHCPFEVDEYEHEHRLVVKITKNYIDNDKMYLSGKVVCAFCGTEGPYVRSFDDTFDEEKTRAEAIEAWNTRAERTCELVDITAKDTHAPSNYMCNECGATRINPYSNYCPNCGAKVVPNERTM